MNFDELMIDGLYTLTDEEGNDLEFQLIAKEEIDGMIYVAMYPLEDNEEGEYVVLKVTEEDGEASFMTVDDDDEFEKVAAVFEEKLIPEIDYDETDADGE